MPGIESIASHSNVYISIELWNILKTRYLENQNKCQQIIEEKACDVWCLYEPRNGQRSSRAAKCWFLSGHLIETAWNVVLLEKGDLLGAPHIYGACTFQYILHVRPGKENPLAEVRCTISNFTVVKCLFNKVKCFLIYEHITTNAESTALGKLPDREICCLTPHFLFTRGAINTVYIQLQYD